VLADAVGPGSVDPTDPSNFSEVTIFNDRDVPIRLMQCDTFCSEIHDVYELPPGASTSLSVAWGFPVGYYVLTNNGLPLGCLRFDFPRRETSVVVLTSMVRQATPPAACPD
jgi:hypothetical protein